MRPLAPNFLPDLALTSAFKRIRLRSYQLPSRLTVVTSSVTMEPLSARIPGDLYLWLAQLQVEGATTNSDKLRVLLGQLKRQHEGSYDYVAAHAWARDLTSRLRDALVRIEGVSGSHSAVLAALLEHTVTALALVISQVPGSPSEAARLEDVLIKRSFDLFEALLRQAVTGRAAAYDPAVVHRHMSGALELSRAVNLNPPPEGA